MKKTAANLLFLFLCLFIATSSAFGSNVLGPKKYLRTTGAPNVYTDTFHAAPGEGRLIVKNGDENGKHSVSSALVLVNGQQVFGPNDFNQQIDILETPVNLAGDNSISIDLGGKPGSYLTIQVTGKVELQPTITISAVPESIQAGESSTLSWISTTAQSAHIDNGIGVVSVNGSTTVSPEHTTTYTITVTGPTGSASAQAVVMVTGNPEPQPEGSFGEQYEDLIPPDATVDTYDSKRFSLITGLVRSIYGSPVSDVSVTIHGHPEYGTVSTDIEGRFSIPVEGGGVITIVYEKERLIPAHRKVYVPWNDIAIAETIRMIAEDPVSTTLTFDGNSDTVVTHQSTEVADEFGSRSCSMVFTGDNKAYLVDEEGNDVHELTTITTRATEFTTPESMPAVLPPTSGYTYCVELGVDGVQRVRFEKPIITWVDNFLGFDVGEIVPVGYYDPDRDVWVPSDNGVVVKLLDTDYDGIVDALDADGDNQPDDLDGDGFYSNEVTGLEDAQRYPAGSTFWRFEVTHFTSWDCNWPYGPPSDAISPNPEGEPDIDQVQNENFECQRHISSFVEERSRIFHDDIHIPGTDITLHYDSNNVEVSHRNITVPVSGDTVPASLTRIICAVEIAGKTFDKVLDPLPNQKANFIWDGLDYLGRQVSGTVTAHVSIGFMYPAVYHSPFAFGAAFARAGNDVTPIRARMELTVWKHSDYKLATATKKSANIIAEGWTLSSHHYLSPKDFSTLHKGNGTINTNIESIINTVVSNGTPGYSGDGGPASQAQIGWFFDIEVDAGGNLYIADPFNNRIRRVDRTTGIITTVAGNGTRGYSGDGGLAIYASLCHPNDVTIDAEGNLYIADTGNNLIRKVDTNGIITTVVGNGYSGFSGDEGPATDARLYYPYDIEVDAVGNLYIADYYNRRIRKVDTNGIIYTIAGGAYPPDGLGDGGPAIEAQISWEVDLAADNDGNLYIADSNNHRIRKVDTKGIITTVAGNGTMGYSGDGGPAIDAQLCNPFGIAVDETGNLYIADEWNFRIRKVNTKGIITTIAGNGIGGYSGDGGAPTHAQFDCPNGIAVDPAGNIYIADMNNFRIRKMDLQSIFPAIFGGDIAFIDENGLGYIMSRSGRHEKTIDVDTRAVLYEFVYNQDNNLVSITDRFGNQIAINRDGSGVPLSITSPDGLLTTLTINSNNRLAQITYPDGGFYSFEYSWNGLMTAKIEPEGNRFDHVFDSIGRLTDVFDEEGGHWNYGRTGYVNGDILTKVTTGEGNLTSYLDHTYSTGAYTSTITDPTGAETLFTQSADGLTVNKSLACGMELEFKYDVDSEYKLKYVKEMTEVTPAMLERYTLRKKTYDDTDGNEVPDLITDTITVNGKATTLVHNTLSSQKVTTSPEGRTITSTYDPTTLLTTTVTTPGLFETTYGYDLKGRMTYISTNTRQTTFTYDGQGNLASITDPEGYTTRCGKPHDCNQPAGREFCGLYL